VTIESEILQVKFCSQISYKLPINPQFGPGFVGNNIRIYQLMKLTVSRIRSCDGSIY